MLSDLLADYCNQVTFHGLQILGGLGRGSDTKYVRTVSCADNRLHSLSATGNLIPCWPQPAHVNHHQFTPGLVPHKKDAGKGATANVRVDEGVASRVCYGHLYGPVYPVRRIGAQVRIELCRRQVHAVLKAARVICVGLLPSHHLPWLGIPVSPNPRPPKHWL